MLNGENRHILNDIQHCFASMSLLSFSSPYLYSFIHIERTYKNSKQFLCQKLLVYVLQVVMKICAMNAFQ